MKKYHAIKGRVIVVVLAASVFAANAAIPVVVVPDKPTAVEQFAASELAGELGKCLGATKAAKAIRGEKPWQSDEVLLMSVKDGVVLDGDPACAPIYAVDLYLEKYCGVRWWTSEAATYPKLSAAPIAGISLNYAPQFKYRETYYLDGFDPLFKVRSKGNFTSKTRYLLSELKFVPPEMGGNHRLYFYKGRHSAYHSFFEILPPNTYFAAHLLWNPADDEKRIVDEFLAGYYGKSAAPILKKFIDVVENGPRKTKQPVKCNHKGAPFLTGGDKLESARLMDEAVAAAEKDGEQFSARVRRERLSVDFNLHTVTV